MDNNQLLNEFDEILKYGSQELSLSRINFRKVRAKKRLLYFMMGATQSYSKSIYKLLKPPHIFDKSAEVIFRSLFENYINMRFVFTDRSDKGAIIFAIQPYLNNIKFANQYKQIMVKYPTWNLDFNSKIKTITDWDKIISVQKNRISKIEKKYKITAPLRYPKLIHLAIEHDKALQQKGMLDASTSLEFLYIYYYGYLSDPAHLNTQGIERFLDGNAKEIKLDIDAPVENITRILSISYLYYYIFLKFYLMKFGLYKKEEFAHFNKIYKTLLSKKK
jgi:hypothetical protein